MPEMADAGEEHGGVPGVAEADAVFVVLPAAGLDDGADAAGQRDLQGFEREGGVGGHDQRAGAGKDGALVPHFPDSAPDGVVGGALGGADRYGIVAFGQDYGVGLGVFNGFPGQEQRPHFGVGRPALSDAAGLGGEKPVVLGLYEHPAGNGMELDLVRGKHRGGQREDTQAFPAAQDLKGFGAVARGDNVLDESLGQHFRGFALYLPVESRGAAYSAGRVAL